MKTNVLTALFLLSVLAYPSIVKAQDSALIRANTGNPAEHARKVRAAQLRVRSPRILFDEKYDFEKRPDFGSERIPNLTTLGGSVEMVKKEIEVKKWQPLPNVQREINTGIGGDGGPDPMLAVGEKTVLVANTNKLKFFDKVTGKLLQSVDTTNFFSIFLSPDSDHFASKFYNVPKDVPFYCSKSRACKDTAPIDPISGKRLPCNQATDEGLMQSAYDVRVLFQKEHRRFVIIAALRNETSRDNDDYNNPPTRDCSKYLIRLVGIAVSLSENPTDGFYYYRTRENNYRDWPMMVADQDYLVLTHHGGGQLSVGTSIVTVFSFTQMKDGANADNFKITQAPVNTPVAVMPVTNVQTDFRSQAIFFVEHAHGDQGQIRIWYIKKPADPAAIFRNPPTRLTPAGGQLTVPGANFSGGKYAGITYHDNNIYAVSHQLFSPSSSLLRKGYGLNVFRIPVHQKTNGDYEASTVGLQREVFKHEGYSYTNPSIAVDHFKVVAIQFIRLPRDKHSTEKQQLRTKVKFSSKTEWEDSQLVRQWTVGLQEDEKLDYSWIVKDPFNIRYFWHAHKYKTPYKDMWIGRIDLNPQ